MRLLQNILLFSIALIFMISCSRKEHAASSVSTSSKTETKTVVRKIAKTPTPKVITVDDRAAKKTPDGRMYYDLAGKRYWKNYNDGKYYLFNKNMYNDPAFKPH